MNLLFPWLHLVSVLVLSEKDCKLHNSIKSYLSRAIPSKAEKKSNELSIFVLNQIQLILRRHRERGKARDKCLEEVGPSGQVEAAMMLSEQRKRPCCFGYRPESLLFWLDKQLQ